ncbi:MAG: WGR domain-containing protein [Oscillospiraceae bacterium]|nr:WGR domain-containing protein [Oscillospiraceae bacterium]
MQKVFHFRDVSSDKFWRVETLGEYVLTNWGKKGTNGRWQLSEFGDAQTAEREAAKQVESKTRSGYLELKEFDPCSLIYKDIEDFGPHPLTSHPVFREYFSDALYYDCIDEEAPFGSDEGSDTLWIMEEQYKSALDFADFPRRLIEEGWEMNYISPDPAHSDEYIRENGGDILMADQVIIAAAFGQIKMTGESDRELRELAFKALDSIERINRLVYQQENSRNIEVMRADLKRFEQQRCGKKQQ